MKKINISILSLLMIFAVSTAAFSSPPAKTTGKEKAPAVTYIVMIHMPDIPVLCNTYQVVLRDAAGNNVAPPQTYIVGQNTYYFLEIGQVNAKRTADFVITHTGGTCQTEYSAIPATRNGPFYPGGVYLFDLSPRITTSPLN